MSYIMQTDATPSTHGFQYRASAPKNPRSRRELLDDLVRAAEAQCAASVREDRSDTALSSISWLEACAATERAAVALRGVMG